MANKSLQQPLTDLGFRLEPKSDCQGNLTSRKSPRFKRKPDRWPFGVESKEINVEERKKKIKKESFESVQRDSFQGAPDNLEKNLDLIIVGFNPGLKSGTVGHHYAGHNNHFYHVLHQANLTPRKLHYSEDKLLLDYGIGLTNICPRTTRGSDDLSKEELRQGAKVLLEKLSFYSPKMVCFNGKGIFEVCIGRKCNMGLQPEAIIPQLKMPLFVVPSSSGRVSGYQMEDKAQLWKEAKKILDQIKERQEVKKEAEEDSKASISENDFPLIKKEEVVDGLIEGTTKNCQFIKKEDQENIAPTNL